MISDAYARMTPDRAARDRVAARIDVVDDEGHLDGVVAVDVGGEKFVIDLAGHRGSVTSSDVDRVLATVAGSPIAWVVGGRVQVGFDWFAWEESVLFERRLPQQQPTYSRGIIPYTRIPFGLRAQLNRVRISALRLMNQAQVFPTDPVETAVDRLRAVIWSSAAELEGVHAAAPESRDVVLTHDLDEEFGFPGVRLLRDAEHDVGAASAVGILSQRYRLDEAHLRAILDDGCEVFSHGYLHDGTLAFHEPAEIRRRLRHFFQVYPSLEGRVRGFRSGQLVRSERMYDCVGEFFEYDMTPPTVELGGPHGWRTGCATTHPFIRPNGLVQLPLTLPQDYFLAFIDRLKPAQITARWVEATRRVWSVGGVAVQLVHPDNVVRRPSLLDAYRDYLVQVANLGARFRLPGEIAASVQTSRTAAS